MSEWITTNESYPEYGMRVLVWLHNNDVHVGYWSDTLREWVFCFNIKEGYCSFNCKSVKAWCEIPKLDANNEEIPTIEKRLFYQLRSRTGLKSEIRETKEYLPYIDLIERPDIQCKYPEVPSPKSRRYTASERINAMLIMYDEQPDRFS